MDEMERYREKIERRMSDRRQKNDRREYDYKAPPFFDWVLVFDLVAMAIISIILFFAGR